MLVARDLEHLQLVFALLTSLFDRVGLKTRTLKIEAMTFLLRRIRQSLLDEVCIARMDHEARETAATQKVRCKLCQVELCSDRQLGLPHQVPSSSGS